MWDGQSGPLYECLTQELRALQAPMYPGLVAAAHGDRSNPGVLLNLVGTGVTLTLFTECRQQARGEGGTGAGQRAKQSVVRQCGGKIGDLLLEALDGLQQHAQLRDQ